MEIEITIPQKYFGINFGTKKYRRFIPGAWPLILDGKRRLTFVRYLALLPQDKAMTCIVRDILGLPKRQFARLDPADIAAIATRLDWMNLPSTQPVLAKFQHNGAVFALPKADFVGGTAYEFAQADDYYTEWIENPQSHHDLLRLVATLTRLYSTKYLKKTGDARTPLPTNPKEAEHDIELRALQLLEADIAIIVSVLRYFEGLKKEVHEYGTASGIFPKIKENDPTPPTQSLFGWWTAFRNVAKSQNKTEEQVWQMSLWRVLAIMIEEKTKADELEKRSEAQSEK